MVGWRLFGDPVARARRRNAKLRLAAWAALKHGEARGAIYAAQRAAALAGETLGARSAEHGAALLDLLFCQIAAGEPQARCDETLARMAAVGAAAHDGFVEAAGNMIAMLVTVVATKAGNPRAAMELLGWLAEALARRRSREAMDVILQASLRLEQADCLAEACDLATRLARLCEAVCGPADERRVGALNRLGLLLKRLERFDEAVATYQRALEALASRPTDPLAKAALLHNLGTAHAALQQFPQAAQCLGAALELRRSVLARGDPELNATLFNLADALCHCRDYERAAPVMLEYLQVKQDRSAPAAWRAEPALYQLAASTMRRGATADAFAYLQLLRHLQEKQTGPDARENLANTLCLIGEAAFAAENYAAAAEHLRAALVARRGPAADRSVSYRANLARLAECHVRMGEADAAEPLLRELDGLGGARQPDDDTDPWMVALGQAAGARGCV